MHCLQYKLLLTVYQYALKEENFNSEKLSD